MANVNVKISAFGILGVVVLSILILNMAKCYTCRFMKSDLLFLAELIVTSAVIK